MAGFDHHVLHTEILEAAADVSRNADPR